MSSDQIEQFANAVADRLATDDRMIQRMTDAVSDRLNGQLSGINTRLGKVETRLGKVEDHLDRIDSDLQQMKGQVGHLYRHLEDQGII